MLGNDTALIKMITSHYWIKRDAIINKIELRGRTFFNKFEKINEPITSLLVRQHEAGEITIAHSLINERNQVENIVFDYNGRNTERFWHRVQLLLREEGFINFTAYKSKTSGHLHVYVHKGHTTLSEGEQIAKMLSLKLGQKMAREWRMFPTSELPREFNILTLPYNLYQKERGAFWSKHM